ncbi:MptD family putative ECF transporter S component [Corynebacterium sp. 335C]
MSAPAAANPKLTTRNLIDVGVFTALYFVVMWMTGMIGIIAPIFMFVGWAIGILLNGIVVALHLARTPKIGALTIMGLVLGILLTLTGHYWGVIPGAAILGLIGDVIVARGPRATLARRIPIAYAIFTLVFITPLLPIFYNADAYYADIATQMGQEYTDAMRDLFQPWLLIVWTFCLFILGYLGGLLGVRVNRRHFSRSGLA